MIYIDFTNILSQPRSNNNLIVLNNMCSTTISRIPGTCASRNNGIFCWNTSNALVFIDKDYSQQSTNEKAKLFNLWKYKKQRSYCENM